MFIYLKGWTGRRKKCDSCFVRTTRGNLYWYWNLTNNLQYVHIKYLLYTKTFIVSYEAVFCVVTQRFHFLWGGALGDHTKNQSFEASNRGQFSCRCTLDQWLDLIGVISSWETKYFKQEPIQLRFDFSGVLYFVPEEGWFGQPKYNTPLKSKLRCIGSCLKYLVSQHKERLRRRLRALSFCQNWPARPVSLQRKQFQGILAW